MGLRVLWVIDGLWVGGTERSLAELLAPLSRGGVESIVACLRRCGEEGVEGEVLRAGFDVRFLPEGSWPARLTALRRLIRATEPDIVHTALFRASIAGRLAAAGLRPVVATSLVNSSYGPERVASEQGLVPWRLRAAQRIDSWTARLLTDRFHAVSESAKAAAVRDLGVAPELVTVVERGRDPVRLGLPGPERKRAARQRLAIAADAEVVLNVGCQNHQKNQRALLEAMARLSAARPRLTLLIAGREGTASGTLQSYLRELDLGDRIRLLGHRTDVPDLYAAADVFAFPSLSEGLPGAVIEAMAVALPVVAARIPPVEEVVDPEASALLVEPASVDELAQALERVLGDRQLAQRLGDRGREIFERRFTLERSAERMIELYRRWKEP